MKPTNEQIDVLLKIQHKYQTDHTKGNKTFAEYVDMWWDFFWYRRELGKKEG